MGVVGLENCISNQLTKDKWFKKQSYNAHNVIVSLKSAQNLSQKSPSNSSKKPFNWSIWQLYKKRQ